MAEDQDSLDNEVLKRFDRSSPENLLRSIAAEMARLHQALAAFETRLAALEAPGKAVELPNRIAIDAGEAFHGAHGFYQLEHNRDGVPIRWTGPEPDFHFEFAIDRSAPAPVALYFEKFYAPTEPRSLRGQVDDQEIAIALELAGGGRLVARGELPARPGAGVTRLRFICPKTGSPSDEGASDQRVLGLLFRALEVGPTGNDAIPPG
jgi:hypothetical protein